MQQSDMPKSIVKNALILGVFAALTVAMVAFIQQSTKAQVSEQQRLAKMQALGQILPAGSYNNDLLANQIYLEDPLLGKNSSAYVALLDNQPAALILQISTTEGYSGTIELLVGILADGTLSGVRTLSHKETPGLGDKIELSKSQWILGFAGKSLSNPTADGWAVKKDRGEFDQFAGATITPRAVVKAVHKSLEFFDINQQQIFTNALNQQSLQQEPIHEP